MALTAQEELLAARRAALAALKDRIADTTVGDSQLPEAQELLADVERQLEVLGDEAYHRAKMRAFAEAKQALLDFNKCLLDLKNAAPDSPLVKDMLALKATTAAALDAAIENAKKYGFAPAVPPHIGKDLETAKAGRTEALAAIKDLRADQAALYADSAKVAEPCLPCLEKRLSSIVANDKHFDRATESATHFSGQQNNKDSCALMSAQSILLERDGKAPPEGFSIKNWRSYVPSMDDLARLRRGEKDMIDIGKESGGYSPCNGTTNEAKIMNAAGIPATLIKKPTLDQIAKALDEGKAVVVAYDARPIWEGMDPDKWTSATAFGHAVRVTGVDRGPLGEVRGFWINDSGDGSAGAYVEAAAMKMALDGFSGGRLSASDMPILPPIN